MLFLRSSIRCHFCQNYPEGKTRKKQKRRGEITEVLVFNSKFSQTVKVRARCFDSDNFLRTLHFLSERLSLEKVYTTADSEGVFESPDQVNPLPAVEDLQGSAMDAQVLALHVWLAARRYDEYRRNTVCLCIAENLSRAYVVALRSSRCGRRRKQSR